MAQMGSLEYVGALAALLQVLPPEVDELELEEALELELELELDALELDETLELLELLLELLDETLELLELLMELEEELELLEETEPPVLPPPPPHAVSVSVPTTAKRKLADAFKVRVPKDFMRGRPLVDIM